MEITENKFPSFIAMPSTGDQIRTDAGNTASVHCRKEMRLSKPRFLLIAASVSAMTTLPKNALLTPLSKVLDFT